MFAYRTATGRRLCTSRLKCKGSTIGTTRWVAGRAISIITITALRCMISAHTTAITAEGIAAVVVVMVVVVMVVVVMVVGDGGGGGGQ